MKPRNNLGRVGVLVSMLILTVVSYTSAAEKKEEPAGAREAGPKFNIRPCGIKIVGQGYAEEQEMRAFNWSAGTEIALLLVSEEGGLVANDDVLRKGSELNAFKDDTGKSLIVKEGFSADSGIGSFPKFSKDGKAALITVEAKGVPAPGAKSIQIKAVVAFNVGGKKNKFEQKSLALKKDAKITAGPIPMTVTQVEGNDDRTEIVIEAKKDLSNLVGFRFLDAKGEVIESEQAGYSRSGVFGSVTEERTLRLAGKHETATIELEYWADLKEVKVPVELTVGLGMPEPPPAK